VGRVFSSAGSAAQH